MIFAVNSLPMSLLLKIFLTSINKTQVLAKKFLAQETSCKTAALSDIPSLTPIPKVQNGSEGILLENTQATSFPLGLLHV